MLEVYKLIARVAPSTATVLVQGESGTGKEVVARAIHANGPKASGPFVALNCAAIPKSLLESELFGHEKGAFSGAVTRKIGRFELAKGGTLFLDEIADMSLPLQAKILRAVQEREIERVGGGEPIPIDVRLIAASNRELRDAIQQGRFREDLYYRLAVVIVRLPRLSSERGGDLGLLAAYFARQFAAQYGKEITGFSDRALELLSAHRWVGNVRELRNAIEQAVIVADGGTMLVDHLPDEIRGHEGSLAGTMAGELATLAEAEARHIARVLAHTGGQIGAAATILGIHRNTLTRKIREYGLLSGPRRDATPLRVERALRLLPDLEALTPLRALLVATSRADAGAQWASSGPYLTLGKRSVDPAQLRRRLDDVLEQITEHLSVLYHAYIDALEALTSGDLAPAVAALLRAGRAEEAPGRLSQARVVVRSGAEARRRAPGPPTRDRDPRRPGPSGADAGTLSAGGAVFPALPGAG